MGAVNVKEDQTYGSGSIQGHLHPEASRQKSRAFPETIYGQRRTPSIFSESLTQDSIALDVSHVGIA
jgi:hypothetical protein